MRTRLACWIASTFIGLALVAAGCDTTPTGTTDYAEGATLEKPIAEGGCASRKKCFEQTLIQLPLAYAAACNAGDADAYADLLDEDFHQMPPDQPAVDGQETVRENMRALFSMIDLEEFTITNDIDRAVMAHNWGFMWCTYSYLFAPMGSSDYELFEGKALTILRHQDDGTWKAYADCFNSNGPPAAARPATAVAGVSLARTAGKGSWGKTFEEFVEYLGPAYGAALNDADVDAYCALLDENFHQMPPDGPAVDGREAVRANVEFLFSVLDIEDFTVNSEKADVWGDWGYNWGTYSYRFAPLGTEDFTSFEGKFLTILHRQDDGSWLAYADCFNSNVPPAE